MFDLTGKVALITGSSRGIGKSIAECMVKQGAKVVISSRKAEACTAVADEIKASGGEAVAIPCNIGRKEDLQALVDGTRKAFGKIDILVCNAATNPVFGPMTDVSDDAYDKIMDTNVKGAFWLCNMVLPEMAERGDGAVILISSIASMYGNRKLGIYGISKAAEQQLVRNLAVEWGPKNIRVNAIAPGLIRTDFARALWEDDKRRTIMENVTPLQRIGEPEDIGWLATYLASDGARFVTGQTIVADGGRTIGDPS
ncbi:SDR family NAD(P)-dependent oxidoreductase [Thalassobaculum salexigens]|uniref:SDR family NAD(P)-dependent oxidoreductase n=1 Tax=Thalassobaculum salexigens TaxID=455360 RepID=UPI00248F2ED9|nr:SDR family oxidoreductase [Thalassobaculum salexigens]